MIPNLKVMPDNGVMKDKLTKLKEFFVSSYGLLPEFYSRAPGRVNLIGEHIDYSGYAVLPMAIKQDIIIAVATRTDNLLCISNANSKYENFECDINTFKIDKVMPSWYKYVLCGIQGIKDHTVAETQLPGLSLAVTGDIPPAAGLSSSSALVCAAGLALAHCLKSPFQYDALAEIFAKSERYIGTQGGGMDQAVSMLSKAGSAQLIEFDPLHCSSVSLPSGAQFVVVNSLVEKEKAFTSDFNIRVDECKLTCRILALKCNKNMVEEKMILSVLQKKLGKSFPEMLVLVKEFLHSQPYSKQEICELLNLSREQLEENILNPKTRHINEFHLYNRALHVFEEARCVWEFKKICDEWKSQQSTTELDTNALQNLGKLMQGSHASAQFFYECSHPKLDKLVELSRGYTYGARLTGAGWGGCIVALLEKDVGKFIDMMKKEYYAAEGFNALDLDSAIFCTEPSDGACVFVT